MTENDICFIDIETTGLHPHRHGICQIGAVCGLKELSIEVLVESNVEVDDQALFVNGETLETVRDPKRMPIKNALNELLGFAGTCRIAGGHNPAFDLGFIRRACDIYGATYMFSHRSIDTHTMFVDRFGFSTNMDTALRQFGLAEESKPHKALTGAKCARALYIKLKGIPCIQQ